MRVLVIVKATPDSEAGVLPPPELLAAMGAYNQQLVDAAVMLAGEGVHPSARGVRVRFDGDARAVVPGPFGEAAQLLAGFWLWTVRDMNDALDWIKRSPFREGEVEIRPVFEADDFAPSDPTGELRAAEARLRSRVETGPTPRA